MFFLVTIVLVLDWAGLKVFEAAGCKLLIPFIAHFLIAVKQLRVGGLVTRCEKFPIHVL